MSASRSLRRFGAFTALTVAALAGGTAAPGGAAAIDVPPPTASWLETVNFYRASSGLAPVVEEPAWAQGAQEHASYLANTPVALRTGHYASAHSQNPESPYASPSGDAAARASNIASGTPSERAAIDGWMRAPFHAIGILRPNLQRTAFARSETGTSLLDVVRGLGPQPEVRPLVVFPGHEARVTMTRFTGEFPDPREGCVGSPSSYRGLPLVVLLPTAPPPGAGAWFGLPDGRVFGDVGNVCVQTVHTFASTDEVYGPTGRSLLAGDHAVLIIPREPLQPGRHGVTLVLPGQDSVSWAFEVVAPS